MTLTEINQIPRGAVQDGFTEDVFTEGFGHYFIHVSIKGRRRYFDLHGWYVGNSLFSTSINDDRAGAIRLIKEIADARVDRYRNEE